jgi:flagellar hook assembly protein FlgD
MKRMFFLFILYASTAYPQTYYMNVRTKGGGTTSIPIQDIQKLTFSSISAGVGKERQTAIIKTFILLQNYPNPFNPTTTIEYHMQKSGNVEIKIFNLTGQLVKIFRSTHQPIGMHTVKWDGRNDVGQTVASGLYLYQVFFENSMYAKKMLFLK